MPKAHGTRDHATFPMYLTYWPFYHTFDQQPTIMQKITQPRKTLKEFFTMPSEIGVKLLGLQASPRVRVIQRERLHVCARLIELSTDALLDPSMHCLLVVNGRWIHSLLNFQHWGQRVRRRSPTNAGARVPRSLPHSRTKRRFGETGIWGSLGTWTRRCRSNAHRNRLHIGKFKKQDNMNRI